MLGAYCGACTVRHRHVLAPATSSLAGLLLRVMAWAKARMQADPRAILTFRRGYHDIGLSISSRDFDSSIVVVSETL